MDKDDKQQVDSPKVLVAEDEPLIRMDIAETLSDDGFHVLEASSGSEALRLIDDPDHVVLVVTDVNMPGADGRRRGTPRACPTPRRGRPLCQCPAGPALVAPNTAALQPSHQTVQGRPTFSQRSGRSCWGVDKLGNILYPPAGIATCPWPGTRLSIDLPSLSHTDPIHGCPHIVEDAAGGTQPRIRNASARASNSISWVCSR